jgi:ribonuclease-3
MAVDGALESAVQAGPVTPAQPSTRLASLEASLGYGFKDPELLGLALTHVGAAKQRNGSYQRLEFLGDRVLGVAISAMLYATFPDADEGELSRRLADLVRKESCATVAEAWNVEDHIRLGPGERTSVTLRRAILGDICESIIGAVFLDGGLAPAQDLVHRAFAEQMHAPRRPLQDPKTGLQEWAQAKGLPAPVYRERDRRGPDHAPEFTVAVIIERHADAEATGPSKRVAEQAAAFAFMVREGLVGEADGT